MFLPLAHLIDTSSTIATSLPLDAQATKTLASKAVSQMGDRRGGKHTLKHIGQVRKVMVRSMHVLHCGVGIRL